MPRRLRLVLAAATLVVLPAAAWAQSPPPSGPPPSGPGGSGPTGPGPTGPGRTLPTGPGPGPTATAGGGAVVQATGDVRAALEAAAGEAAALVALGAVSPTDRLGVAVGPVVIDRGAGRAGLNRVLRKADQRGSVALGAMQSAGVTVSRDVQTVLSPLSAADEAAAASGRPISIDGEAYVRALDHLAHNGGGPPAAGTAPDPASIAATLTGVRAPSPGSSGSRERALLWLLVVAVVAAVTAWIVVRRRGGAGTPVPEFTRPVGASPPVAAPRVPVQDLLEVSRRLTGAASTGNIDRVVVREAVGLVGAARAALVRQDEGRLSISVETEPELLLPEALDEGVIRRVAETGQPVVQVSATERSIRSLPAALAAVPLVGGGRVEAVLVLLREEGRPFSLAEREVLQAFAPVAAAALHTGHQAAAAIEESLLDPLTGVGNRRRFDAELGAALRDAQTGGWPTALFIADLDRFKSVNDVHGHPAGDALLRQVVARMADSVRPGDSVYRFGGEEFCVLLRETTAADAADVAERVRQAVAASPFDVGAAQPLAATASFGVAANGPEGDAAGLLARADEALYRAKNGGRNRVEVAG